MPRRAGATLDGYALAMGAATTSDNAFKAALWELTQAIARHYSPASLPIQALAAPQYKSDREWNWVNLAVPQPQALLGDLQNKWLIQQEAWPELQNLLETVEPDPELRRAFLTDAAGNPVTNPQWWMASNVRNFFVDYFRAAGHELWMGGRSHFDELVETLLVSIHNGHSKHTLWAPLYGLTLDEVPRIDFSTGVSIEEPPPGVLIRIAGPLAYEPSRLAMRFPRYFLRLDEEHEAHSARGADAHQRLQRCPIAIRLVVGGRVRISETYEVPFPGWLRGAGEAIYGIHGGDWYFHQPATALHVKDVDEIETVMRELPRLETQFPIPFRRFALTAERLQQEDILLDASIGLEGLLIPDRTSETTELFALRGAWVLEPKRQQRQYVYRRLKKMYDVRSRVVHANTKQLQKLGGTAVNAAADEAVDRLRQLLRYVVESGMEAAAWEAHITSAPLG